MLATAARNLRTSASALTRRILISDPIEAACVDLLKAEGYEVDLMEKVPQDTLVEIIGQYDGLIVRSGTQVTAPIIEAGTRLQIIGRAGTGVDNIDVDASTRRGIMVMNTPGGNTASAAEMSISLIMALARNVPQAHQSMTEGRWDRKKYTGTEVDGKTIGIVGLGHIGRRVAKACIAMGMKVIAFDPLTSAEVARSYGIEPVKLDALFEQSDFISLHCPLTDETRNLIGAKTLAKCKNGVRIVNCARGGIIDEVALLEALDSGKVAGAAMDVYETEPPPETSLALFRHPRVIATPHLGASTDEAQDKVAKEIAMNMINSFEGRSVAGVVNSRLLSELHARKDLHPFIELTERIGSLQSQIAGGEHIKSVSLRTRGPALKDTRNLLRVALIKGLLTPLTTVALNMINAPAMAEELGLEVTETHEMAASLHTNSVTATVTFSNGTERKIVGTCVGSGRPRIVQIDNHQLDLNPEGTALIFDNLDKPGTLASIAAVLAESGINISSLALSRDVPGGRATNVLGVDSRVPAATLEAVRKVLNVSNLIAISLPPLRPPPRTSGGGSAIPPPTAVPTDPCFSSGPCPKRPGYDAAALRTDTFGRSHRSKLGVARLAEVGDLSRKILGVPKDYYIGMLAGSDTGAFEAAMWNMIGPRDVDVFHWEAFGKDWAHDVQDVLGVDEGKQVRVHSAPFGKLPELKTDGSADVVFTWNGTTSGVKVPNADWIPAERDGLVFCDATSAVFAMDLDWPKLDVVTWSWQKALGSEGAHGMIVLSPRAVARLEAQPARRGLPKIFRLTSKGKFDKGPFQGKPINTPSMLAVEDCLDALNWGERIGGLSGMMARSQASFAEIEKFVEERPWASFLAEDPATRSTTSVCLSIDLPEGDIKKMVAMLEEAGVAYDIGAYRSAPPGLRIWCGSTVEPSNVAALMAWIEWAYLSVKADAQA
jgi:D-3-phosphoglycerate dehydrogenase